MAYVKVEPYVMVESEPTATTMTLDFPARRPTNQNATSPDDVIAKRRYVGYIPDLLRALAALLVFRYELYPVPDASYGYRKASREWSGLIGELVSEVREDDFRRKAKGKRRRFAQRLIMTRL